MDKKILIIVAHPDDAEFGMGGTIAKLSKNNNVTLCVLCNGNRPFADDSIEKSRKKALKLNKEILGIKKIIQHNFNYVSLDTIPHLYLTNYI